MGCFTSKKIEKVSNKDINFVYSTDKIKPGTSGHQSRRSLSIDNDKQEFTILDKFNKHGKRNKLITKINISYTILAEIGKGTFTRVFRIENKRTKKPYALKVLESSDGREAIDIEISILRRVKCPYIIHLEEVFEIHSERSIALVMTLATGGNLLEKIISYGAFTEVEATRILKMILKGVKYLHSLGISHRDLKLENILYYHPGKKSKIMISDFAVAHAKR